MHSDCLLRRVVTLFAGYWLLSQQLAVAADIPDPEAWYRNAYAPLWAETPAADMQQILEHYAIEIITHEVDGVVSRDDRRSWLVEPMQEWVEEGWLRAELTALQTTRINASTASFVATWMDYYQSGEREQSCGWYLADFLKGRWLITAYADTACP